MNQDRFHYCLDQLKRFDHDRYLAVLLAPETIRGPLTAFFAFDAEMMRIPTTVSEPMLADIRFQWWRETLDVMTPMGDPGHEIAAALSDSFFELGLAPSELLPLMDLRSRDLAEEPFSTLDALIDYHRQVACQQIDLLSRVTHEVLDEVTASTATTHLLVYGLINQIRRLPHDAASSQLCLPLDLMGKYDIDPHEAFQGVSSGGVKSAMGELLGRGESMMVDAGDLDLRSHPRLVPALLPTILRTLYAAKLRAPGFDLFRHSSEIPAFRRQLRYLRVKWSRQFQG
ncbi:MAG: squalene/phytoene synthase family protein [Rhodobiaceae bacterium]|nr:squalene/phytoene synthase family protein [Rhodobiaceae bacterium]